jgi:hypothetical protein
MLTNKRLVEISEMRPIDKLFNILVNISESNQQQAGLHDDFLDFASMYSMEETCTMLIQIVSDRQATYQVS